MFTQRETDLFHICFPETNQPLDPPARLLAGIPVERASGSLIWFPA